MKSTNYIQSVPIKNCWMCGTGVIITKTADTSIIQCMDCLTRGLIIKCENKNEIECIKQWNNSRILLSDNDIASIASSISKDPNIDIELITKLNEINTYNTHYLINNDAAKRFGYGAIIDPHGNIEYCMRPHVEILLKYFNIDYDTLNPNNIDYIYKKVQESVIVDNNFLKIGLYITILICHIPKKYNNAQIMTLIEYLNVLKTCYTSINKFDIYINDIKIIFSTFDAVLNYLLDFIS